MALKNYIAASISVHKFPLFLKFRGPSIVSIFLLIYFQLDATLHSSFISGKLLYTFRVASPPIIGSTHNSIYRIWYLNTVVCAPDDGWRYYPKHVQQFSRKKNNKLCNVASCWKYIKMNTQISFLSGLMRIFRVLVTRYHFPITVTCVLIE